MSLFGHGASDGGAAASLKKSQANTAADISTIDRNFAGFDPAFYKKASDTYTAATMPGMLADYDTTKNNLTYALARGGILNSGAAVQRDNSLQRQLSTNESQIANSAQDAANTLRTNVNQEKGQLYQQAQSGADPSVINSQSLAAGSQLRAPAPIQPLGNLFANWSQQYLSNQGNYQPQGTMSVWNQLGNSQVGNFGGSGGGNGAYSFVP